MKMLSLSSLAILLATLANTAVASNAIDGTYAMTMEAMGVQVRSATVELTPQYIREGENTTAVTAWEHSDGYVTARDKHGATLLNARIEDGGDTLIQQIEGIGTATFTRID